MTLNKRLFRFFAPLGILPIVLVMVISVSFSYNAAVGRAREVARLRAEALASEFGRQHRAIRDLDLAGVGFYRQRLIETFIADVSSTSTAGQGVLIATRTALVYGLDGALEPQLDDPVWEILSEPFQESFTMVSAGTGVGLSRGRYIFSGRYSANPAVWVITYESMNAVIEPVMTTTALFGVVGFLSFLLSLVLANRFARRISRPLTALTGIVTAFGHGDHAIRAGIDDDTEVGILAREFNAMADELSRFTGTLEEEVRIRTEELRRSLAELQETQAHLLEAEKHKALGKLVVGLAHELNTPVGVAITATDYLRSFLRNPSIANEDLRNAVASSTELTLESLDRVVTMIRRLQSITQSARDDECKAILVHSFFRDWFTSLEDRFDARGITLIISADCSVETATYPLYLWQVIAAIAENALDHAFPSNMDRAPRFVLYCDSDGESLNVYLKDNGVGVALTDVERLFEPFFTTRRDIGKAGLNLHIAFSLVTGKLGGKLQYLLPHERSHLSGELAEPEGACFVISIPITNGCTDFVPVSTSAVR